MLDKMLKVLRIVAIAECIVLAGLLLVRNSDPQPARAAHQSSDAESLIVTIESIELQKEDETYVTFWKGSEDVDIASGTVSLSNIKSFSGDIPPGKYKSFKAMSNKPFKVKGTVVLNGKTYYTKASHTGHANPPAEYEELKNLGVQGQVFWTHFDPTVELGGSISSVSLLMDISYFLTYYDGDSTTSLEGFGPDSSAPAGMYLRNYLPYAVIVGQGSKKEIYHLTTPSCTGTGRLTIIYDANDIPIAGSLRKLYIDNAGYGFDLTGWLTEGEAGATSNLQKNANGTLRINVKEDGAGATGHILFSNFLRSSHSGSFTSTAGYISSGSYTATRIQ